MHAMFRSPPLRHGTIRPLGTLLALAVCAGCIARHVAVSEKGMTCTAAQTVAFDAIRRMGYAVTESTRATPGSPGLIIAARSEGGGTRRLVVTVSCSMMGAELAAESDAGLAAFDETRTFARSVEAAKMNRPPPRPPSATGVDVLLIPEPTTVFADRGIDLGPTGVTPVRIRITNRTTRQYRFHRRDVVLRTEDGRRVRPLTDDDLSARVGPAAVTLQPDTLQDRPVAPDATVSGFLFFPFDAYVGARVELVDPDSDEAEGFSIDF
jgi:hypothetical protein